MTSVVQAMTMLSVGFLTHAVAKQIYRIIRIDWWNHSLQDYLIKGRLCICRKLQSFLRGTSPIRSPEPPSPRGREDRNDKKSKIYIFLYYYLKRNFLLGCLFICIFLIFQTGQAWRVYFRFHKPLQEPKCFKVKIFIYIFLNILFQVFTWFFDRIVERNGQQIMTGT